MKTGLLALLASWESLTDTLPEIEDHKNEAEDIF
jgi:hypothetical protein